MVRPWRADGHSRSGWARPDPPVLIIAATAIADVIAFQLMILEPGSWRMFTTKRETGPNAPKARIAAFPLTGP